MRSLRQEAGKAMKGTISQAKRGETEVHAEQVRMLYEGASTAALVNAVNAAILTFLLWDVISHAALQGWLGAMCLLQVSRLALTRLYQARRLPQPEHSSASADFLHRFALKNVRWGQWYLATAAASGLVWGAAGFWLFPREATIHQLALSFILGGTVAGATAVLAPLRWAFALFALPALLPLSARFFLEGTSHYLMMGTLVLIFLFAMLNVAHLIHSTIVSSIKLRLENRDLVAALTVKADDLRQINRLLKTEIHGHTQATDQLRDRSFFLQQLIDAIPNPVFYKGLDGVYQGCNEAMAKFFGVSKTGFSG
jgi:PAS domain-containing protein